MLDILSYMLSMVSTKMIAEEDTPENREQAIYDIAWLTENMIMRNRTHGGNKVLLDELWEFVEEFNADMVILWEHMSSKALDGMEAYKVYEIKQSVFQANDMRQICFVRSSDSSILFC